METKTTVETALQTEIAPNAPLDNGNGNSSGLAAVIASRHGAGSAESNGNPDSAVEPKRGPGRPPTHGLYSKAAGSNGKNPAKVDGTKPLEKTADDVRPVVRARVPAGLLSRVVQESITVTEKTAQFILAGQAKKAGLESAEIDPQLKQAEFGEGRKKLLGDLAPYVCEEWGIDPEMSPTLAACLIVGPWIGGMTASYLALASLAKEKAEHERSKPTTAKQ